jgi:thiol-disulfide isomerase/thioredoxin
MIRTVRFPLAPALALLIALGMTLGSVTAQDKGPALADGNWKLSYKPALLVDSPLLIFSVKTTDGKPKGEFVAAAPNSPFTFKEITIDGTKLTVKVAAGDRPLTLVATIDPKSPNKILGTFGDEQLLTRGVLESTTDTTVDMQARPNAPKAPEPFLAAQKIVAEANALQNKLRQAKEPEAREELQTKLKEAQKAVEDKVPALYKETIEKHGKTLFAAEAATQLLRSAIRTKATSQDVSSWLKVLEEEVSPYGAGLKRSIMLTNAESLKAGKDYAPLTASIAKQAMDGLKETESLNLQSRALKLLKSSQIAMNATDDAKATDAKLEKLELALDKEYFSKVPPFKAAKFAGRKDGKANRVAVLELFTGAQCPPCVAADVAFDALEKSYEPKDLVLIQYHMHIPGPDPMTNPDTMARWDYYRKLYPMGIRGVPSSLVNGKSNIPVGGGMANSKSSYDKLTKEFTSFLEETTDIKIGGTADLTGETVKISVNVDGVKDATPETKLRLLLVEEEIRFLGGNGIRFHHQVVRAMPGGSAGTEIKEASTKKTEEVDLAKLRSTLSKYLDGFEQERGMTFADKPLALKHLKVIVLVQDDKTGEILQAAEIAVKGGK